MDNDQIVIELAKLSTNNDILQAENILENLLQSTSVDVTTIDLKNIFVDLLLKNTPSVNLLVVKCIAEVTKNPSQRIKFSNVDMLEKLMDMLGTALDQREIELTSQLCRAMGNIFYSNDDSRNIIFHQDGGKVLIKLLEVSNKEIKSVDGLLSFSKNRSGVLSNYLLGNEELSQKAIEFGIIDLIKIRIKDSLDPYNDTLLEYLLPILSILTEQVSDLIFNKETVESLIKILKSTNNSDVAESCLELLQCQAESDEIKLYLAKEGVCQYIFELIEKEKASTVTIDFKRLIKPACDLIVLILTGDEAMHFLDETPLLSLMQKWLNSTDEYLINTSVLAIGNFARTDNHCIRMVDDKILIKLMEILKTCTHQNDPNSKLQLALLSAIRNLVIPKENKGKVIEAGLVEIILPMLNNQPMPVIFKVIGTLRMLIDGQDELALRFLKDLKFIERCVELATKNPDMIGVNSESSRLLAWMIKNAYQTKNYGPLDSDRLEVFLSAFGSIEVLVKMLNSTHLVMQNESVIALTLIASFIPKHQELNNIFIKTNIGVAISDFISRISETERMTNEIIDNLSLLIKVLKKSDILKNYLDEKNIDEKAIPRIQELATL